MKKIIAKEKHTLPLTYKYLEFVKNKTREKQTNSTIECEIHQTDQYVKLKPPKFLTRLL